jgi:hypothetical protein
MRPIHAVLMLFLSACAAGPEYHQGAYRPAPPMFVPSQDAPHTVGQPGHLRPQKDYPKSPHKRPLPPTREPGIWASEDPDSAFASIYDKPWPVYPKTPGITHSLDLQFEAPPELDSVLPKETADVRLRCQWNMTQARLRVATFGELTSFPARMQKCAHAKLVLHCYGSNIDAYAAIIKLAPRRADVAVERVLGGEPPQAAALVRGWCVVPLDCPLARIAC